MTLDELIRHYPRLYHMAEEGTWPSIERSGLLSTSALLDHFEIQGHERRGIEATRRPESVRISHPQHGEAVIRDQKPLSESALFKCLSGMTPKEWYKELNGRVFFWLSEERLLRLLQARAYRGKTHCVLTLDTQSLLQRHAARVTLSPINSGSTVFRPQPRGKSTFARIQDYPFDDWRRKRGIKDAVVELAVDHRVADVRDFVIRVAHMKDGKVQEAILDA